MYAVNDNSGTAQLMDVYLAGSPSDVTAWSNTNFDRHYNGNRQPFGIYIHPSKISVKSKKESNSHFVNIAHLTNYPGLPNMASQKEGVVSFIKSLESKPDVWFVTNEQLLQWVK